MEDIKFIDRVDNIEEYLSLLKKKGIGLKIFGDNHNQNRSKLFHPAKPRSCKNCDFHNHRGKYSSERYCLLGFNIDDNDKPTGLCISSKSNNNTISYDDNASMKIEQIRIKINGWNDFL